MSNRSFEIEEINQAGVQAGKDYIDSCEKFEGPVPPEELDMGKVAEFNDSLDRLVLSAVTKSILEVKPEHFSKSSWVIYAKSFVLRAAKEMKVSACYADTRPLKMKDISFQEDMYDQVIEKIDIDHLPNLPPAAK